MLGSGAGCCGAGMSAAEAAFGGTATPDCVLFDARSDGEGEGAGGVIACCCCGCTVDWLESTAIRVAAALLASSLATLLLAVSALLDSALAVRCFFTGAVASFTGAVAAGAVSAAAGDVVASAAGIGAGAGAASVTGGGFIATTALGCEPVEA